MARRLTVKQKRKNKAMYNYIRKVYNKTNKEITYKQFKFRVLNRAKGTGESYKEAAINEARTRTFMSAEDIARENILKGIKEKFRDEYKNIRKHAGRFESGEKLADKLEWDEDYGAWVIVNNNGKRTLIDISNSPEGVRFVDLGE